VRKDRENREFKKKRKNFIVYKNPKYEDKVKSLDKHTEEEIRKMANREIDKILDKIKKKSDGSPGQDQED